MISFEITKKDKNSRARTGVLKTVHGEIQTPAFAVVGTKATVKSLTPEQIAETKSQVVLANTYHLYLEPGEDRVANAGGFGKMMGWKGLVPRSPEKDEVGPTITDSGGFQVFSLGAAFGTGVSKIAKGEPLTEKESKESEGKLTSIDEDGVTFKSYLDGSEHRFTPERSMEIQWKLGADIIFAFDECTSPHASYEYQKEAMDRTHRWAQRSLDAHEKLDTEKRQVLFGVVQGGRFQDLRQESARTLAEIGFDGFGIGGSFNKDDLETAVGWATGALPDEKPRHLLGIGEPLDLFAGVAQGIDLFDCVSPTRRARNGSLYTKDGLINIGNSAFRDDQSPIESDCGCYTCTHFSKSYLAHLFRSKEILANTLATMHNVYFINDLMEKIRDSIRGGSFDAFRKKFTDCYTTK